VRDLDPLPSAAARRARVSDTPGLPHQSATSREASARKKRPGGAGNSRPPTVPPAAGSDVTPTGVPPATAARFNVGIYLRIVS